MSHLSCDRCGTCCRKGGPALHESDTHFLATVRVVDLVCLRRDEPAYDPRVERIQQLGQELIKIRGKHGGWECLYYDEEHNACGVYDNRPQECQALSCKDTTRVRMVMETPALTRAAYVDVHSGLWTCLAEHEQAFPVASALELAGGCGANVQHVAPELDLLLRHELAFRAAVANHVQAMDEDLWPYLGRPLWRVLLPMGRVFARYQEYDPR